MLNRLEAWQKFSKEVKVLVLATQQTYTGKIIRIDDIGFAIRTESECICFPFSTVIVFGD